MILPCLRLQPIHQVDFSCMRNSTYPSDKSVACCILSGHEATRCLGMIFKVLTLMLIYSETVNLSDCMNFDTNTLELIEFTDDSMVSRSPIRWCLRRQDFQDSKRALVRRLHEQDETEVLWRWSEGPNSHSSARRWTATKWTGLQSTGKFPSGWRKRCLYGMLHHPASS